MKKLILTIALLLTSYTAFASPLTCNQAERKMVETPIGFWGHSLPVWVRSGPDFDASIDHDYTINIGTYAVRFAVNMTFWLQTADGTARLMHYYPSGWLISINETHYYLCRSR